MAGGGPDHSVFVGDLAPDVTDYVLQENFRQFFPSVRSAKVITDPITNRSKGYGFVRFGSEAERDRALGDMMGHVISNRPIRVSVATAKKNPPGAPSVNAATSNQPHPSDYDPGNTTLFIGGLSASVSEDDLRSLFGRFGDIIYVKIPPGRGCGFVQYVHRPIAEVALSTMQSQVLGGSAIRISWGRSSANRGSGAAPAYSQYPGQSAYPAAGGYPGYDPAAYGAYPPAAPAAHDPYAGAYAAYAQQQAPPQQQQQPDLSAYQAFSQGLYGIPGNPSLPAAGGAAATVATAGLGQPNGSLSGSLGASANPLGSRELLDPLASVDVKALNAAYVQRHAGPLTGSHLHP